MNYEDDLRMRAVLSNRDIMEAMNKGAIFIAPFNEENLQPSEYNLTPTYFVYSTKKKRLLPLIKENNSVYVMIDRNDTVLIRTREAIAVSDNITGNFDSKLRNTSVGFGHISTTLDPGWEGQLLIPYNNPTNKKLRFDIEQNVSGKIKYNAFVTVTFNHMNSAATKISDNTSGRWDILDNTIYRHNSWLKRNKVGVLEEIADKLKDRDKYGLQNYILDNINDKEKEEYYSLENNSMYSDEEYEIEKKELLTKFLKTHVRKIRIIYEEEMLDSIDIVNRYIEAKQEFLPFRYKIMQYIKKHIYKIIGILLAIVAIIIIYNVYKNDGVNEKTIVGSVAVFCIYILCPTVIKVIEKVFVDKMK